MSEQNRFGEDGTESTRSGKTNQSDDKMSQEKENVTHLPIIAKPK
jgi:hypothetical protein